MSKTTMLGEAQLTHSTHSVVTITLEEPDNFPAAVLITWPLDGPTVVDPNRFGDVAALLVKLFSEAHIALAAIKVRRKL
jgi:hypothetical protein